MSKARMLGIRCDDAALARRCNPHKMRQHYIALDNDEIANRLMQRIRSKNGEKRGRSC